MSIALLQLPSPATRLFLGTLTGGEAIHEALARLAQTYQIETAVFHLLGGLSEVELSEYDFVRQIRKPPLVFRRPLEIIAGHGTLCQHNGQPHVHLHLTLSYRDESAPHGIALLGGHAVRALAFAVEFTLTAYDGIALRRALHPPTGLSLWDVPPLEASNP